MAIDDAEKRKSISGIWFGIPGVTPNIGRDQEWRVQSGWSYSGILPPIVFTPMSQRMRQRYVVVDIDDVVQGQAF